MANIVRFDPFTELNALQRQFFGDDWVTPATRVNVPTTDVYTSEDGKEMSVEVHLPNFDENDINISVDDGALVIQAQKHEKDEDKKRNVIVRESAMNYYRRILLPDRADTDNIQANLDDGVLNVMIPLTPLPQPKQITVKAKTGAQSSSKSDAKGSDKK